MSNFITAEANPTKEFFVDMITRDIPVDRAILDLIDNSIDGAHRLVNGEDFTGKHVHISINKDSFSIKDNCGGISRDIAEHQAFVFGKPANYTGEKHSIGRFGIGMKRALFKIGKKFRVTSHHAEFSFVLNEDVNEWVSKPTWDFNLEVVDPIETHGTDIVITNIPEGISSDFELQYFISALKKEISTTHSLILKKGFEIYVNDEKINSTIFDIKNSIDLNPEIVSIQYSVDEKIVNINIYTGVSDRDINKGGWYIFCNDRLIVDADRSDMTGWQYDSLPKYHPDFAYFRGYVTFDSDHADLLPWTTTKTGLNTDSEIYKIAFFEMKKAMKKIISFLKLRVSEDTKYKRGLIDSNPLTTLIEQTPILDFLSIEGDAKEFNYRADEPIPLDLPPAEGRIQYSKPKDDIELMKKYIGVSTNKDVGIYTFDYFLELIRDDNE